MTYRYSDREQMTLFPRSDQKHGFIVSTDVISESNDRNQFAKQIKQANDILEKKCSIACADTGYDNTGALKEINDQDIKISEAIVEYITISLVPVAGLTFFSGVGMCTLLMPVFAVFFPLKAAS